MLTNNDPPIGPSFAKGKFYIEYGVPLILLAWLTFLKLLYDPIGRESPYLLYFALVIITARYFGQRAAIMITVITGAIINYFFTTPYNAFTLDREHIVQALVFFVECGLIIWLTRSLSNAVYKMRKSEILFKTIVEKSSEAIVMKNADGTNIYCSPAIKGILGYTPSEYLLMEPWALNHQDELLDAKEQFYRLASHPGKTVVILHRMEHKNGNWLWIECRMSNLLYESLINAIVISMSNVNDRIVLEQEREGFMGIVSHELKTPLTSLKAYTHVLQNRFNNEKEQTTYGIISKMDHQVNRIVHMIADLLDHTNLQAGKLTVFKADFDFNTLLTDMVDSLQHTLKKHSIVTNLAPTFIYYGDKERIGQVITNLLSNAVKYSPDADEVNIGTKIIDDNLIVSVSDTGIGISVEETEKIFGRFYRADHSKKIFEGLGLGLFICKQIVALHGGSIGVDSEKGKGATFWFSLPLIAKGGVQSAN